MNVVQWLAHSVEEYDQLRLLTELGHTVFSPGAYIDPRNPAGDKRPALDIDPVHEMKAVVDALGQPKHKPHGHCDGLLGHDDTVEASKRNTPAEIIDWADVLIVHHLEHTWLIPQWHRLRHKRVIWRTVGQSGDRNELMMKPLRDDGCQIVRYSPKERNIPSFAGEDALIRFYKDPDEYGPWTGERKVITNITQSMYRRSLADDGALQAQGYQWCNYGFWDAATQGLSRLPAGPGSEAHGGLGALGFDEMKKLLREARAYLYTGTQPASYTLGMIEAMMSGIPLISIGPTWMRILPYGPEMFEGHEIAPVGTDDPNVARKHLKRLLLDDDYAEAVSAASRYIAVDMFGKAKIKAQWDDFLSGRAVSSVPSELVAA